MKNKLKVGIVGAPRGQSFIRSFQAIEETDVIAICDLNIDVVEGVASQFNIDQKYTEFEKMVQSDLDIVVVSTPMPCTPHNRLLPCRKENTSFQRCPQLRIFNSVGNLQSRLKIAKKNI